MFKTFAEITNTDIYILGGLRKAASFASTISDVVLYANIRQTAIRVADISAKPSANKFTRFLQGLRNRSTPTLWELVKSHFPFGEKMNEQTHIFDGTVFANKNEKRYLMTAIPKIFAETLAETALQRFGKINRLDVVENLLFHHFSSYSTEDMWIILPQCDGFCVLHMINGLPRAAWNISNHLLFRREELERNLFGGTYRRPTPPTRRIYLLEAGAELVPDVKPAQSSHIKTAPTRAVILQADDVRSDWMCDIFEENDIDVELMDYMEVLERAVKR